MRCCAISSSRKYTTPSCASMVCSYSCIVIASTTCVGRAGRLEGPPRVELTASFLLSCYAHSPPSHKVALSAHELPAWVHCKCVHHLYCPD